MRQRLRQDQALAVVIPVQPCVVAMEACGGAHDRGCEIGKSGRDARLFPLAWVNPFDKRQKTDAADAEALCDVSSPLRSNQTIREIF